MEQVNEAQPQSQPPSQRFYALEQLGELAGTITLISEGLQAYRAQVAGLLAGQKKAEAFELYRLLERQRTYLVEQIRATRPFLMELENPLAPAAQKLAEQLAAFPLMTADYSKLTEVLKRFADALPDHQTTDASIIGRLMNNVRLGHYPTDLTHVGYIANSIVFPAENTANLIDPCCGTGDALLRLALGTDSQCYCALLLFQQYILPASPKIIATSFTIFATYARRMFPCLMTGSLMLKCTPLRYFIVGLRQLRVPQRLIVAVSVTLRYFPAIREEMGYIRDAMKLRDVRGLARLEGTVIPLMVSATETAEELSAAAVTRGIEDPAPKTSAVFLRLSPVDLAGMAAGLVLLALSFVVQ